MDRSDRVEIKQNRKHNKYPSNQSDKTTHQKTKIDEKSRVHDLNDRWVMCGWGQIQKTKQQKLETLRYCIP